MKNPKEIANIFNQHYCNIGKLYAERIAPIDKPYFLGKRVDKSLFLRPTNQTEIIRLCKKLEPKESHGYDCISNALLKHIIHNIADHLTMIFNKSISEGIFPEKNGATVKVLNYRPVSLLPVISKLLERVIYNRVCKFLGLYDFLYTDQYGFRKN